MLRMALRLDPVVAIANSNVAGPAMAPNFSNTEKNPKNSDDRSRGIMLANSERLRREGYRNAVAILADRFDLRDGLGIERATDLLLLLGSSATYLTLRRYGWSDDDYVTWATDTLSKQLLARAGRT